MKLPFSLAMKISWASALAVVAAGAETVSLKSLLVEMADRDALARFPEPAYQCLQASSYNRASTNRLQPDQGASGWFADSDGLGFLRQDRIQGRTEWVLMEHQGPGCIAKMWTPFFYYGFGDRTGPNVRIYLDGADTPVIDESLIKLVTGQGSVKPPLAAYTARAGNAYLPIPFARSCKVTMVGKPFYHIVNYRAYPPGTTVESFTRAGLDLAAAELEKTAWLLSAKPVAEPGPWFERLRVESGASILRALPPGSRALRQLSISLPGAATNAASLRSTVLAITFDGEETVWCPVGDFFCSPDSVHPFHTWQRTVTGGGVMICRWVMPYRQSGQIRLLNLGPQPLEVGLATEVAPWPWDERSMHFHANWRPDDVAPGTPFQDWNFVDIRGQGVFVGDAWTVLNMQGSWWGEGDEKIYVDGAWDRGFPTHFGTGTEDYYGWAGGEVPTRKDEFSVPFLANVRVGGLDGFTTGFNICTRARGLDAIPFTQRLVFDMESSFGTDIRNPWNLLGYSAVSFWYALPGASHNRPALPEAAARPIMSLAELEAKSAALRKVSAPEPGTYEFELLRPSAKTRGLPAGPQRPAEAFNPKQWSGEAHFFIPSKQPGDFVEFTFTEQFSAQNLTLHLTTSYDFGVARIAVNGKVLVDRVDLFSPAPAVMALDLGRLDPVENRFVVRCELVEANGRSRGARTFMGLDRIVFKPPAEAKAKPAPAAKTNASF